MAFSSPIYLDHHHNWHQLQQPNNQQVSGGETPQLPPPPSQLGGNTESSIRPGSMVDRARLAKLPLPEAGLNCPRCDSTNTKFCYFNNYSLTQPRHFCKTCRRYWTRGGALRSVPVGGGCRRNKRSKSRSSKSPIKMSNPSSSVSASPSSSEMAGGGHFPQLPLMTALQNLPQYGGGNGSGNTSSSIGAFQSQMAAVSGNSQIDGMGFHIGNNSVGGGAVAGAGAGAGAGGWRLPFLAGFEPQANLFNFQSEGPNLGAAVKEEESRGLNLSRQFLGITENNNQYWIGNGNGNGNNSWAEFSGLNSSASTTHFL